MTKLKKTSGNETRTHNDNVVIWPQTVIWTRKTAHARDTDKCVTPSNDRERSKRENERTVPWKTKYPDLSDSSEERCFGIVCSSTHHSAQCTYQPVFPNPAWDRNLFGNENIGDCWTNGRPMNTYKRAGNWSESHASALFWHFWEYLASFSERARFSPYSSCHFYGETNVDSTRERAQYYCRPGKAIRSLTRWQPLLTPAFPTPRHETKWRNANEYSHFWK